MQGAWPDLSLANSLALTASLELMDLLFARLPAHTGAAKQHSRDVEAAAASMRAFVSSSLPLGSYTGLPPLEGDPKARIPHVRPCTPQPMHWTPLPPVVSCTGRIPSLALGLPTA